MSNHQSQLIMAKQKATEQEIDEFAIMNLIAGDNAIPQKQVRTIVKKDESVLQEEEPEAKPIAKKGTAKKKKASESEYEETFLCRNNLRVRQSTYIGKDVHAKIVKLMKAVGNTDVTIGNFIDNVLLHHFDIYDDEIKDIQENYINQYKES